MRFLHCARMENLAPLSDAAGEIERPHRLAVAASHWDQEWTARIVAQLRSLEEFERSRHLAGTKARGNNADPEFQNAALA